MILAYGWVAYLPVGFNESYRLGRWRSSLGSLLFCQGTRARIPAPTSWPFIAQSTFFLTSCVGDATDIVLVAYCHHPSLLGSRQPPSSALTARTASSWR